jgi:hypothetical protein
MDADEITSRILWIRPDARRLLESDRLDRRQAAQVRQTLKRFVVGGGFNVVTAAGAHREVDRLGDIKELRGAPPPFVEMRFKPPKDDLRFLGRFAGKDALVLTGWGLKSLKGQTGAKPLSVADERRRCDDFLKMYGFDLRWCPTTIEASLTNGTFL